MFDWLTKQMVNKEAELTDWHPPDAEQQFVEMPRNLTPPPLRYRRLL